MLTPNLGKSSWLRRLRRLGVHILHPQRRSPGRLHARVDLVQQDREPRNVHELRSHNRHRRLDERHYRLEEAGPEQYECLRLGRQSPRKA